MRNLISYPKPNTVTSQKQSRKQYQNITRPLLSSTVSEHPFLSFFRNCAKFYLKIILHIAPVYCSYFNSTSKIKNTGRNFFLPANFYPLAPIMLSLTRKEPSLEQQYLLSYNANNPLLRLAYCLSSLAYSLSAR